MTIYIFLTFILIILKNNLNLILLIMNAILLLLLDLITSSTFNWIVLAYSFRVNLFGLIKTYLFFPLMNELHYIALCELKDIVWFFF